MPLATRKPKSSQWLESLKKEPPERLSFLANKHHELYEDCLEMHVDCIEQAQAHCRLIGECLAEMKSRVKPSEWTPWLMEHFQGNDAHNAKYYIGEAKAAAKYEPEAARYEQLTSMPEPTCFDQWFAVRMVSPQEIAMVQDLKQLFATDGSPAETILEAARRFHQEQCG